MDNKEFEKTEDQVAKWLEGYSQGTLDANHKWIPIIHQLCRDLNEAHNEILKQQGILESEFNRYDWPEWTNQANSIRWAERETRVKLAKTNYWTLWPDKA